MRKLVWWFLHGNLGKRIHESLDHGVSYGYDLSDWTAGDLADDLKDFNSMFENVPVSEILPHVKTWLAWRPPIS